MADTYTTNLNLTKPEPGAAEDTWGISLNADLDALDAIFGSGGTAVSMGAVTMDGLTVDGVGSLDNNGLNLELSSSNTGIIYDAQNGYHTFKRNGTNALQINGGNGDIAFYDDTGTSQNLKWDASADSLNFVDNAKAQFGTGSDLSIFHNGTESRIEDSGTGNLVIKATNLELKSYGTNENYLTANQNGAVTLYHNNQPKIATTSTGIDVTGTVTSDALTVQTAQGDISIDNSSSTLNFARAGASYIRATNSLGHFNFITGANNFTNKRLQIASNGDISFYDDTGTTQGLFWDASAESLGIGTTSPSRKVAIFDSVDGYNLELSQTGAYNSGLQSGIVFTGKYNTGNNVTNLASIRGGKENTTNWDFGGNLRFYTRTNGGVDTERLRINSSGNVGIGTNSPARNLHVHASNFTDLHLTNDTTGATASDGTSFTAIGSDIYLTNREAGNMVFQTLGTERSRINSAGIVMVATTDTNPHLFTTGSGLSINSAAMLNAAKQASVVQILNRTGNSDGIIQEYKKDSTTVGSIGTRVGDLLIGTGNTGLQFYDAGRQIIPRHTDGSNIDAAVQLGSAGSRFTDLYLSDAIRGDVKFENNTGTTEYARFDSSGNLLVGKTSSSTGVAGARFSANGFANVTRDGGECINFNRLTSDGTIIDFRRDSTTVGNINCPDSANGSQLVIAAGPGGSSTGVGLRFTSFTVHNVIPCYDDGSSADNHIDLGNAGARFDDIYATNGTIQTSDRNEKQDIQALTDAEQRVATACKGLIRRFRWQDAVEEKGDDARLHFGVIAQDLQDAFTAEGLDAGDYGMFISSTWADDDGNEQTRLGVRYNELLAFIITTL